MGQISQQRRTVFLGIVVGAVLCGGEVEIVIRPLSGPNAA